MNPNKLLQGYHGATTQHELFQAKAKVWQQRVDSLGTELQALSRASAATRATKGQQLLHYREAIQQQAQQENQRLTQAVLTEINSYLKVNGRKRQILTDVGGRILACRVHAANGHDGVEALQLLPARPGWGARLVPLVMDKGYRGRFARHVAKLGLTHQIGSRPPSARGFVPVAKRWVVERTFAWRTGFRRLAIDDEFTPRSHETWLLSANMTMCLNRLDQA